MGAEDGERGNGHACTELSCPAGDTFSGGYGAGGACGGGTFTVTVSADGTTWTGTSADSDPSCSGGLSGTISGVTFIGTGLSLIGSVQGTVDCTDAQITGTFSPGAVPWAVTTNYCPDPHDVNNIYPWSNSGTPPDGTAFTAFLGTLNNGTSSDGAATSGCFAGHCDWRLPAIGELEGIADRNAPGCSTFTGPCIDQTVFGPTVANAYWSATSTADGQVNAWFVYFGAGVVIGNRKTFDFYVRGVRSGL